jgi:vanillate O-demethylase ferredoxin subunit
MSYVIEEAIQHGTTVKEFHIRRQDGGPLPDWLPGSHIILRFTDGNKNTFENHYSLIGVPGPTSIYRIAVQRELDGKGGSRYLHDEMTPGSVVEISGPYNSFPLTAPESSPTPRVMLIAGGIGITPMMSMAYALNALERPFELHYLARNPDRLILLDELRAIRHATIMLHMSQESGRTDLLALLGPYHDQDTFYACGPTALLQGLADAGTQMGWPVNAMRFESFGPRAQSEDEPLIVSLSLSQMEVEVQPGTSILDALIAADVFVSYDCKRGECASCFSPVLEGEAIHRDVCLAPAMRMSGMCTCVSWAKHGRLVLEL